MRVYWEVWRIEGTDEILVGTTESFETAEGQMNESEAVRNERWALVKQSRDEFNDLNVRCRLVKDTGETLTSMETQTLLL